MVDIFVERLVLMGNIFIGLVSVWILAQIFIQQPRLGEYYIANIPVKLWNIYIGMEFVEIPVLSL